jgi:hypothetical protein
MTQEFDPRKSYLSVKAHEKMVAYVGFGVRLGDKEPIEEGVIKISSFNRPYGGGYLTLTFIIDTKDNEQLKARLNQLFSNLTEDSLKPYLGKDLEKIAKVSLDSLGDVSDWYIQEVTVYFRSFEERENVMIEEKLIPAFEASFPFSFDKVQWWPPDKPVREPEEASFVEQISLKALFRKWFKGDR